MKNPQSVEPSVAGAQLLEGPLTEVGAIYSALVTTSIMSDADRGGPVKMFLCTCTACGTKLPENEARKIAEASTQLSVEGAPLLERCANCEGTEFQFRIQPESARHWIRVKERLAQTAPDVHEVQVVQEAPRQTLPPARLGMIATGLVMLTVLFFVVRYWIWGSPIPLVHKPQKYEFNVAPPPPSEAEPEIYKAGTREKD